MTLDKLNTIETYKKKGSYARDGYETKKNTRIIPSLFGLLKLMPFAFSASVQERAFCTSFFSDVSFHPISSISVEPIHSSDICVYTEKILQ